MRKFVLLLIAAVVVTAPIAVAQSDQAFQILGIRDASDLYESPTAAPALPSVLSVSVNGPIVTFTWTAQTDATSYLLQAGLAPGATFYSAPVGNITGVEVRAPAIGTYFVRLIGVNAEGNGPVSNEVTVSVTSMTPVPTAVSNLQASLAGRTVHFSWVNGQYSTFNRIEAGTTPGGSEYGAFPLSNAPTLSVPNFPVGTLYIRVRGGSAAGLGPASNEVEVIMPAGGACSAPGTTTLTGSAYSTYVTLNWTAVPGAAAYTLLGGSAPGSNDIGVGMGLITRFFKGGVPLGTYYLRMVTTNTCGASSVSPEIAVAVDGSAGTGPRTPDPTTNNCGAFKEGPARPCVPPPNRLSVVSRLAAQYPGEFQGSCGNDSFLFRLVQELRKEDSRWGMNWKRAVRGDYSRDVITWHWGTGPDEDSYDVSVIDFIGNHCGGFHTPAWQDHTDLGTRGAVWTLIPYLERGYPPNPQ